jgi:hypothetical protein
VRKEKAKCERDTSRGFTRITRIGKVIKEDKDDWRKFKKIIRINVLLLSFICLILPISFSEPRQILLQNEFCLK